LKIEKLLLLQKGKLLQEQYWE